jgi:hypothetical protein
MAKDRQDPNRRVWECMACGQLNVWNWEDQEAVARLCHRDIYDYANARQKNAVAIAHGSCYDNICGNCGADIVAIDSPIMAYSH